MPKTSKPKSPKPRKQRIKKTADRISADLIAANRKLRREITDRKQADEQLRKLSQAIEQSQVTVVITDITGQIEYVNPKFVEITGYSVEEALGQNPRIMKSGETPPEEYKRLWDAIRSGHNWQGIFHNRKKNGDLYWEEAIISPVFDDDQHITHFIAVKEDITERVQAEETVQKQNKLLSVLYENMLDMLQFQKLDQLLQLIVERAAELLDASYSEIALRDGADLIVRSALPNQTFVVGQRVRRADARLSWQAVDTRQPAILDDYATWPHRRSIYDQTLTHAVAIFPILKGDQCLGIFDLSRDRPGYIFTAEQIQFGQLFARLAALAINNDQTYMQALAELEARTRAEGQARQQARDLALLGEVRTALAHEVELAELLQSVVEAIAHSFGYTQISIYLRQNDVLRLQHQVGYEQPLLEIPLSQGVMARSVRTGSLIFLEDIRTEPEFIGAMQGLTSEICVPLFDQHSVVGALNVESTAGHALTRADANLMQSVGEQINIAIGRAQLYAELRESERRYKDLVDNASEIIYKITPTGYFTFVNPTALRIMGYAETELIGQHYLTFIRPDFRRQAAHFYARQLKDRTPKTYFEYPVITKDGVVIWLGQNVQLIFNSTGDQIIEAQAIARDITDLKQAETALRQHSLELDARNVELNTFAHTVAHDLKNPIGVIIGFSELLLEGGQTLTQQQLQDSLQSMLHSGQKMNAIVEELMLLAGLRQQEVLPESIEMGKIIGETLERLALVIKESEAEINLPPSAEWPIALGYAPWIEEVWVNYLSNAIKYGGRPPQVELGATRQANGLIRFWVRDNGGGLTPEEQSRLFTPFTRLNQVRVKGHGLGLSIVKRIIEKLGGAVGVESEIGAGSTFYFILQVDKPNSELESTSQQGVIRQT
jgi:PAS domain S-box-containing protein